MKGRRVRALAPARHAVVDAVPAEPVEERTQCVAVGAPIAQVAQPGLDARGRRGGWYCTDDVFEVDAEGWWRHRGRRDDMLKVSGQWVSPARIEETAVTLPGVAEAVGGTR